MLVALGRRTAAAEVMGYQFSGMLAWLMWRSVYLGKLPGLEKEVRVAIDWTLDLPFPRDIGVHDVPDRAHRGAAQHRQGAHGRRVGEDLRDVAERVPESAE